MGSGSPGPDGPKGSTRPSPWRIRTPEDVGTGSPHSAHSARLLPRAGIIRPHRAADGRRHLLAVSDRRGEDPRIVLLEEGPDQGGLWPEAREPDLVEGALDGEQPAVRQAHRTLHVESIREGRGDEPIPLQDPDLVTAGREDALTIAGPAQVGDVSDPLPPSDLTLCAGHEQLTVPTHHGDLSGGREGGGHAVIIGRTKPDRPVTRPSPMRNRATWLSSSMTWSTSFTKMASSTAAGMRQRSSPSTSWAKAAPRIAKKLQIIRIGPVVRRVHCSQGSASRLLTPRRRQHPADHRGSWTTWIPVPPGPGSRPPKRAQRPRAEDPVPVVPERVTTPVRGG